VNKTRTPLHSQSYGIVEQHTLKWLSSIYETSSCCIREIGTQGYLPIFLLACRASINSTMGLSPAEHLN
jgi:hypothetical protein